MIGNLALNPSTFFYGVLAALLLGLATGGGAIWYVRGLQIDTIKATHATEVAQMETKVAKAEGATAQFKFDFVSNMEKKRDELDKTYAERVAAINASVSKLSTIRLRDPSASSNSGSTGGQAGAQGSNGSSADGAGLLSAQTSQFLWSLNGEADTYLERLRECKAWDTELEAQNKKLREEYDALKKQLK